MAVAPGSASGGADAAAAASSFKWAVCPATGGQLSDADEATLAAVAGAWFDVDAPAGVLTLRGTVWTAPAFLALSTLVGRKLLVWPAGAGGRPRSKNDAKKQIKLQRRQLLAPREASTTRKRSQPDGQRACPAATGGAAAAAVATQRDVHPSYKTLRRARHQASDDLAVVAYFPPLASGGFRCGSGGSSGDGQGAPTHDQSTAGGQRQQQSFLLRVVSPYLFVYECAAKARWVGQELLPLLCTEFVMFPRAYFEAAIARGLLRLDGRPTRCSDVVRSGAILTHEVLCREPASWVAVASPRPPGTSSALPVRQSAPCRGGAISASSVPGDAEAALSDAGGAAGCNDVVMTADHLEVHTRHLATHGVLLVNKPPGVPVYPTGSFRQATVSKLLERALRRGEQPLARLLVRAAAAASSSSATVVTATAGASGRARGGACGERTRGGSADTAPSSMGVLPSLHFVHRLDWLVSGLLIVAVGRASAQHVTEQLMLKTARATATGASGRAGGTRAGGHGSGQGQKAGATAPPSEPACLRKLYIACVRGKFPAEPTTCRLPIVKVCGVKSLYGVGTVDDNSEGAASGGADGKAGVGGSSSNIDRHGKPAETIFRRLRYAPAWDVSLVQCAPLTGRQHQIRVHLAALGFPILNDRPYGGVPTVPPAGGGGGALAAACRACHAAAPKWAAQKQSELLLQVGAALGPSEAAAAAAVREQFHADWVARTAPARAGAGDGAAANSGAAGGAAAAAAAKIRLTWGLLHACPATRNAKAHPEETGGGGGRAGGGGGPDNEAASPGSAGASRFILLHAQRYQRDGHWDFRIPPPPWVSFIFPDYSSTRRELGAAPTKK